MNASQSAHLALLCKGRRLELTQAIRLARMQLPAGSPSIGSMQVELELNQSCIDSLEPSSAKVAA